MKRYIPRSALVSLGDAALRRSPLQSAHMRKAERTLSVLAYHDIRDVAAFTLHVEILSQRFTPISLEQTIDHILSGTILPQRPILVTFDDGDPSVLNIAAPILNACGIPAVAFVVAESVGSSEPFWWEQVEFTIRHGGRSGLVPTSGPQEAVRYLKHVDDTVRLAAVDELRRSANQPMPRRPHLTSDDLLELERLGIAVGNHTLTHPLLDCCSLEKVEREILGAHEHLSSILGHPPLAFAYPNGNAGAHAFAAVQSVGYPAAFLFDHRPQSLPIVQPDRISRLRIGSEVSADRFAIVVSGLHTSLHHFAGRS